MKLDRNRQYNMKEGLDARYDVFGNAEKREKLNDPEYTSHRRIAPLFSAFRAAQLRAARKSRGPSAGGDSHDD